MLKEPQDLSSIESWIQTWLPIEVDDEEEVNAWAQKEPDEPTGTFQGNGDPLMSPPAR